MSAPDVDVLDPDYCSFDSVMDRRQNYFAAMRHLDELSRQLSRQAHEERERRQSEETPEERERRERHQQRLRDLVLTAIQSDDVDDWRLVDELAFGPGAA